MSHLDTPSGAFLNHLEGIYRPEDRHLAIELAEALGLAVQEIKFTEKSRPILAGYFDPDHRDPTNNLIFLYEMPDMLRRVVDLLNEKVEADNDLKAAMTVYREAVAKAPPLMPHFGVRFRSEADLAAVVDALANDISAELKQRISVFEVPAYKPVAGLPDIRQVFVRTDVLTTAASGCEQAIELQAVRGM